MPKETVDTDARHAFLDSSATGRGPAQPGSAGRNRPEWTTERWKLQVEAEARGRLKKSIRDLGSDR